MVKRCEKCGAVLNARSRRAFCKRCLSVCACGKPKDFRAAECQSCGRKRKAEKQWADHTIRRRMEKGIRVAGKRRRIRLKDLSDATVWQRKRDGRYWTWYWDGDQKRTIYRYQWRWWKAHGEIPEGQVLHHLNGDQSDDRLENLALMTNSEHQLLHAKAPGWGRWQESPQPQWTCQYCGRTFRRSLRKRADGYHEPKYCSMDCLRAAQHSMTSR